MEDKKSNLPKSNIDPKEEIKSYAICDLFSLAEDVFALTSFQQKYEKIKMAKTPTMFHRTCLCDLLQANRIIVTWILAYQSGDKLSNVAWEDQKIEPVSRKTLKNARSQDLALLE